MIPTIQLIAQTTPPAGGILSNPMVMMGAMFVMFYFLLIRPHSKQRKEQLAREAAMQVGDKVVTSSGIHGLVHHIKERSVMIKVADGVMIEFEKAAITHLIKKEAGK